MKIIFELNSTKDLPTSYLSRGHITIESGGGSYSSKGRTPDQSFMLFFAIVDLLDLCSEMKRNENRTNFEFIASDSSFILTFKVKDNSLRIDQLSDELMDLSAFAKEMKRSIEELFETNGMNPTHLGVLQYDYQDAISEFTRIFLPLRFEASRGPPEAGEG